MMLKKISLFLSSIIGGLALAIAQIASAQSTCKVNGQVVPCEQLAESVKGFLGWGIGIFVVLAIFGIWSFVFWIMMLVHAAKHNVENKPMWMILMVFTGIVGALIYYFVEKRKFDRMEAPAATPVK